MTEADPIVIVGAARTPMGGMQGELSSLAAHELGTIAIKAVLEKTGIPAADIDEVLMGNVLPAAQGQAPARQAMRNAGIPDGTGAVTLNKVCGSGMKTAMIGHDSILVGSNTVVLAGGMESMSNAPYMLKKARGGYRYGHETVYDHMALDGLEDAYTGGAMGVFAENTAQRYQFTREEQDNFSIASLERARAASESGHFAAEIVPVTIKGKKGDTVVDSDEQPRKAMPEKIPTLKPAFAKDGTVTAATSSSISDGAAAMLLMRRSEADKRGLTPLAQIVAHATHSQEPEWFTLAPVGAIAKLLGKAGWEVKDVDLWEINEAFACVPMAAMREHNIPHEKVNVNGGACAMGHPIGASGARILVTLLNAMKARGDRKGVASLCIGGGEGVAVAVEALN